VELSLKSFVQYSVIWLPLILAASWGLFGAIYRNNQKTRPTVVIISCAMVVAGFIALQMMGRNLGFVFQEWDVYEIIYGGIAVAIGLLFWGKQKPKKEPPADSATH